jgi:valyl-tRNA synthetase
MKELEKAYDHKKVESAIYQKWLDSDFFNPDKLPEADKRKAFTISLPPPNVTGELHMGHAFEDTIQDAVIRFQRMCGKAALWLPGTDHAAIATQAKFEKEIYKKEGKSRHDFSREDFFKMIQEFALSNQSKILNQLKKMGLSLDWSRLSFTLDKKREVAVRIAFKKMYEAGLIYRGFRLVNWDPKAQTTVSDDEIEWLEEKTPLYYLKYGPFVIATARPETKFGDKYVVMHPDDKRYQKYNHGDKFELEWINGPVTATIIKDPVIDMEFGTGVMTITPWHDATDFDLAVRHNLDKEQIIDERGILLPIAGEFAGEHIKKARPKIVAKMQGKGLIEKIEDSYLHRIATNMRGGGVIEPQIKLQWFIDVNKEFVLENSKITSIPSGSRTTLKEIMRQTVASGQIKIMPDYFEKIYFHWIENLRDWCISRQIVYGHRIPAYYDIDDLDNKNAILFIKNSYLDNIINQKDLGQLILFNKNNENIKSTCIECMRLENGTTLSFASVSFLIKKKLIKFSEIYTEILALDLALAKPIVGKDNLVGNFIQDPDTLDTWFSSGLWTFSTLGWPTSAEASVGRPQSDLERYHPNSVMMPGYEILFFWVARMILMSGFLLGDVPFHQVCLHGMVRDKQGRKFSKSLNNGIDPLEMSEKYGTDALRIALVFGAAPGNDTVFDEQKIKGMKFFANKLWNISRFILSNIEDASRLPAAEALTEADKEISVKLKQTIEEVTKNFEKYQLHEAAQSIYQFAWHELADVYLEKSKEQLKDDKLKYNTQALLLKNLETVLKLLHPFMPFITEEIWSYLGKNGMLIVESWPKQ